MGDVGSFSLIGIISSLCMWNLLKLISTKEFRIKGSLVAVNSQLDMVGAFGCNPVVQLPVFVCDLGVSLPIDSLGTPHSTSSLNHCICQPIVAEKT